MTQDTPDPLPPREPTPGSTGGPRDTHALFAGVGEICEEAARCVQTDGAALAVLTRQAHTRDLVYATDPLAVQLDELQYTLGEGPCFDAYLDDRPQCQPDLDSVTQTSRWPTFAAEATRLGVHSVFAFPILGWRRPLGPLGVLELYRRAAGPLTKADFVLATAFTVAIAHRLQMNWDDHAAHLGCTDEAIADAAAAAFDDPADPFTRTQITSPLTWWPSSSGSSPTRPSTDYGLTPTPLVVASPPWPPTSSPTDSPCTIHPIDDTAISSTCARGARRRTCAGRSTGRAR
jgi:hypothetical protein